MSTEIRKKYELKARAEHQRETRDRIARAAAELHEEKGVGRTTVAEIARRADVSRLTVYNHFPDLESLLPACSAHYATLHPTPDFGPALALRDDRSRIAAALYLLYRWYRETEPLFGKALSDRHAIPELDRLLAAGIDRMQAELADALASQDESAGQPQERRVLLRLAVDFWTWRRLSLDGLDDAAASELMADAVVDTVNSPA